MGGILSEHDPADSLIQQSVERGREGHGVVLEDAGPVPATQHPAQSRPFTVSAQQQMLMHRGGQGLNAFAQIFRNLGELGVLLHQRQQLH